MATSARLAESPLHEAQNRAAGSQEYDAMTCGVARVIFKFAIRNFELAANREREVDLTEHPACHL